RRQRQKGDHPVDPPNSDGVRNRRPLHRIHRRVRPRMARRSDRKNARRSAGQRIATMDAWITALLIVALFALLGSGVWIGLALAGVAWIGMELFSTRPAGAAMGVTIWGKAALGA